MNNVRQIYHSSHCGSTLMSTLLRFSCDVYSEPPWLHTVLTEKNSEVEFYKILNNRQDCIIKFPSIYCRFSNSYPGKKIFLYRNLKEHLIKIMSLDPKKIKKIISQVEWYYEPCIHPLVKRHRFSTNTEKITSMWISRILYTMEVENMLWIKTNDFLYKKQETMKLVCNYFDIPNVIDFSISNYYVKDIGFKPGIKVPLKDINPNFINKTRVDSSFGIIDVKNYEYACNYDIEKSILFVKENFSMIDEKFLF